MAPRHNCGCEGTNDLLPKLVAFFRGHGHEVESYSIETQIPDGLGLESSCLNCQLRTEEGVETAITALHCGPDALITHEFFEAMFVALIRIRLQQEEEEDDGNDHDSISSDDEDSDESTRTGSGGWDWDNIWYEFTKAFELRRNRLNVAQLLRNLSELRIVSDEEWWISVLQSLGVGALLNYEDYRSTGLTEKPPASELSAMRRDVQILHSIDDLFDLYVDIDARVHGYVHAHKMLRIKCLCCCY